METSDQDTIHVFRNPSKAWRGEQVSDCRRCNFVQRIVNYTGRALESRVSNTRKSSKERASFSQGNGLNRKQLAPASTNCCSISLALSPQIVDDLDEQLRDAQPDPGAYESRF